MMGWLRSILQKVRDLLNRGHDLGLLKETGSGVVKGGTELERPADLRDKRPV